MEKILKFCIKYFKKFVPNIGTLNSENRTKWLEKTLKKIPSGSRILDAGAGEKKYKKFCKHLNYVSQDFGQYDGEGDKKGLQTGQWKQTNLDIVSDIVNIPELDSSFDAVMCVEVFEHLPKPIKAIKELTRLLKKGGYFIITAPFCSLTHFAPYHFYSGFNKYFYEEWLPKYGCEIIEISQNGNFFEYIAQELRRLPSTANRYSKDKIKIMEYIAIYIILKALKRLANKDRNSNELLCWGYHILARKKC